MSLSSDGKKDMQDIEALLAAHTDAILAGREFALDMYQIGTAETADVYPLLNLANRLREAFRPVSPSDEFVNHLKNDLVGETMPTLILRWRKLPARYRMMARLGGLTLTAGLTLLAARRVVDVISTLNRPDHAEGEKGLLNSVVS
jgi:hypothetical protein